MLFEMPSKQNKKRIKIKSSFLITQYSLWRKKAEYGEGVNVGGGHEAAQMCLGYHRDITFCKLSKSLMLFILLLFIYFLSKFCSSH